MKKKIIIAFGVIFLAAFFLAVIYFLPKGVPFSAQQKELIKNLGYPTSYFLVFGEIVVDEEYRPARLESWNYANHGRSFYFVDGEFKRDSDIDFIDNVDPFPIRPNKFKDNLSFDELKKIIKAEPTAFGEIPDYILEDGIVYDFSDQLKVGVKDDIVVYIEAFSIIVDK